MNPRMSVRNPGVSSNAPPNMISAPSLISSVGIRPPRERGLEPRPRCRTLFLQQPAAERSPTAISSAMVSSAPITSATCTITYSSTIGTMMKIRNSKRPTHQVWARPSDTYPV